MSKRESFADTGEQTDGLGHHGEFRGDDHRHGEADTPEESRGGIRRYGAGESVDCNSPDRSPGEPG